MNYDIKKELTELKKQINKHNKLYHQEDQPIISDYEYDQICLKYDKLIALHPNLGFFNRNDVGFKPKHNFSKIKHLKPMLSLNNGFSFDDIKDFLNRINKFLVLNEQNLEIVCEPKIDGLSISLTYEKGKLSSAVTRGDGRIGELVTKNILKISEIPKKINNSPDFVEIRGEIFMYKNDFDKLNVIQKNNNEKLFSNPRNAAAGSIRQKDPEVTKKRNLKFIAYTIGEISNVNLISKQTDLLSCLEKWNFNIPDYFKVVQNIDAIKDYYNFMIKKRDKLNYEIDGLVYKVNDFSLQNRLGNLSRAPRWAIAHKLPSMAVKTIIKKIDLQVGRTGAITPVARVNKINVGGVFVSNVSLHNEDEIKRKDIRVGDTVLIERAGDVIPQITQVILNNRPKILKKYEIPKFCPSCHSPTIKKDDEAVRRCLNGINCKAQRIEKLIHFCSKNAFNIDGLGEKQINIFFQSKLIKNFSDIFLLKNYKSKIIKLDRFGELSLKNLFNSIHKSRLITFDRFLFSLGIRQIGENNAKILADHYSNINNMIYELKKAKNKDSESYNELVNIDQIGFSIVDDLVLYFNNEKNLNNIENLLTHIKIEPFIKQKTKSIFNDKKIVITGTLKNYSRDEVKTKLTSLGAKVITKISSSSDYLLCGEKPGSKLTNANRLNIQVLNENEFINLLNKEL